MIKQKPFYITVGETPKTHSPQETQISAGPFFSRSQASAVFEKMIEISDLLMNPVELDNLYVVLLPMVSPEPGEFGEPFIAKELNQNYIDKTFREIIQALIDPEHYSQSNYTSQEIVVASKVQKWFKELEDDPNQVHIDVIALSNELPQQEVRVELDEKVQLYSDRIIQKRTEIAEQNNSVYIKMLELCMCKNCTT